ncbi:methylamine utilization protein [Aliidiomarina celeris]|uniref:methylamine utilization protein n=1 Tax=Aliidiomarina celeris TaxID=2249428 RepID=UPI0013008AC1|nr:methylamine utilization protein [Aliidiomarina celeris]
MKRITIGVLLIAFSAEPEAAELKLIDADGNALVGAVLVQFLDESVQVDVEPKLHIMDQVNRQFSPQRLVIGVGDQVTFPNSDNIRHHVYSFSPARTFELRLFESGDSPAIAFPSQGVVAVGCNIHDQMEGYILVSASLNYQESDSSGVITYPETWQTTENWFVWHPWMSHQGMAPVAVSLGAVQQSNGLQDEVQQSVQLQVTAPPQADESRLEQRFRRRVIRGGN